MCEQPEKEQIKYKKRKRFERRKRNQANGETRRHIYQRIFLGETNTSRTSVIIYLDSPCPLDCSFFVREPKKLAFCNNDEISSSLVCLRVRTLFDHFFLPASFTQNSKQTHALFFCPFFFLRCINVFQDDPLRSSCVYPSALSLYSPVIVEY